MWEQAKGALKERKGKLVTRTIQGDDQLPYPGVQMIALELEVKTNEQKLEASLRAAMVSMNTMAFQMGQLAQSVEEKSSEEQEEKQVLKLRVQQLEQQLGNVIEQLKEERKEQLNENKELLNRLT